MCVLISITVYSKKKKKKGAAIPFYKSSVDECLLLEMQKISCYDLKVNVNRTGRQDRFNPTLKCRN